MPSANVSWPTPLTRFPTLFPGQMGVGGTDNKTGLRQDVNGAVFYVDPNYPGATTTADGTNPDNPLSTIQAAVNKCLPYHGDTVAVMASTGWYYTAATTRPLVIAEEVVVNTPGIRIVGIAPSATTAVMWTPASNGGTCLTVYEADVSVEGFIFTEGRTYTGCNGIYSIYGGGYSGDSLTVRNCTFADGVDTAIQLEFVWFADIHHNRFWMCDDYAIYVDPAGAPISWNTIYANIFHDCGHAISITNGISNHVWDNSIYNSIAQGGGVATDLGVVTTGGRENQVFDNYFSCIMPVGANGDWADLNSGSATDAWIFNHLLNGTAVTTP
jgi:hypothetical protein